MLVKASLFLAAKSQRLLLDANIKMFKLARNRPPPVLTIITAGTIVRIKISNTKPAAAASTGLERATGNKRIFQRTTVMVNIFATAKAIE